MALQSALKTTKAASNVKRVAQAELEIDNYPCRVAQVIDLGLHHKDLWDDVNKKFTKDLQKAPVNMLMVTYEFTTEFVKDEQGNDLDDKPRWLSERFPVYALDSELATSTKRYNAFDPGAVKFGGDWSRVAGEPCSVSITHKKSGKAKIGNVAKPMKGMQVAELKNPIKVFDLGEPDLDIFNSLPEWLQEEIKSNLEYAGSPLERLLTGGAAKAKEDKPKAVQTVPAAAVEVPVEDTGKSEDAPW